MSSDTAEITFIGFQKPASNYYKVPNVWVEVMAYIDTLAELKVVEYLMRHTWGFQEYDIMKHLTIDEFMHGRKTRDGGRMDSGTCLSERSVRYGLDKAIKHGFIEVDIDDRDKARVKKYYRLKMHHPPQELVGVQTLHPRGAKSNPRTEKETLERQRFLSREPSRGQSPPDSEEKVPIVMATGKVRGHWKEAPLFIQTMIEDWFGLEFHDQALHSSITRTHRLFKRWREHSPDMDDEQREDTFRQHMQEARNRAKKATPKKKTADGKLNRMPLFFACLEEVLGLS